MHRQYIRSAGYYEGFRIAPVNHRKIIDYKTSSSIYWCIKNDRKMKLKVLKN